MAREGSVGVLGVFVSSLLCLLGCPYGDTVDSTNPATPKYPGIIIGFDLLGHIDSHCAAKREAQVSLQENIRRLRIDQKSLRDTANERLRAESEKWDELNKRLEQCLRDCRTQCQCQYDLARDIRIRTSERPVAEKDAAANAAYQVRIDSYNQQNMELEQTAKACASEAYNIVAPYLSVKGASSPAVNLNACPDPVNSHTVLNGGHAHGLLCGTFAKKMGLDAHGALEEACVGLSGRYDALSATCLVRRSLDSIQHQYAPVYCASYKEDSERTIELAITEQSDFPTSATGTPLYTWTWMLAGYERDADGNRELGYELLARIRAYQPNRTAFLQQMDKLYQSFWAWIKTRSSPGKVQWSTCLRWQDPIR